MRKIECACGISLDIYSWPSAEVEQNGKKMIERHISCRCTREIVVRTAPKYEPDAEEKDGEKISTVVSFAELSRQCGVLKETDAHNKPCADTLDEIAEEAPKKSITLSKEQAELFHKLVDNYATWFKQGKASSNDQKKFFGFAVRVTTESPLSLNEEEIRMSKMALSERNLFHIYGSMDESPIPPAVQELHDLFKEILK